MKNQTELKSKSRGAHSGKVLTVITTIIIFSLCISPLKVLAYDIPAEINQDMQTSIQIRIDKAMEQIIQQIDKEMNAAVEPLIPQISTMVSANTSQMEPKVSELGISIIKPSLTQHVELQAQIIANEVNQIVMSAVMSAGPRSDPTPMIRSKILSELPRIKKEAIERADQQQIKDMENIRPQIESIIEEELAAIIPEIEQIVQKTLQQSVPLTQKKVEADIDQLIAEVQNTLPEEQRQLINQMRPQFEAAARPALSEAAFEAVAEKIDQKVVDGLKQETMKRIQAIAAPMNQYCTDFAVQYAKTLLPPQVDQIGIRSQIEKLIEESAAENLALFEQRIMSDNEKIFEKQGEAINQQMHAFVKGQVLSILNKGAAVTPQPTVPGNNTSSATGVFLNGKQLTFDVPPIIKAGRTLVPLRAIFEAMGAGVEWNPDTRVITASREGTVITLQADQPQATRNGQPITLDVPATIIDGRTMVPARFISESFGASVAWDGTTKTVNIEY